MLEPLRSLMENHLSLSGVTSKTEESFLLSLIIAFITSGLFFSGSCLSGEEDKSISERHKRRNGQRAVELSKQVQGEPQLQGHCYKTHCYKTHCYKTLCYITVTLHWKSRSLCKTYI